MKHAMPDKRNTGDMSGLPFLSGTNLSIFFLASAAIRYFPDTIGKRTNGQLHGPPFFRAGSRSIKLTVLWRVILPPPLRRHREAAFLLRKFQHDFSATRDSSEDKMVL